MKATTEKIPLVYSCSGCSSAAQMANYLAVKMDRSGVAEMSCIAGIGGHRKSLVQTALSGRRIITIDGCPLACAKACLAHYQVIPDLPVELTGRGVCKKNHHDFDTAEADLLLNQLIAEVQGLSAKTYRQNDTPSLPGLPTVEENSNPVLIREVTCSRQLKTFIDFSYRLYQGNPFYVPQLKKDMRDTFSKTKNPAFTFCEARYWLAYKEDKVVGRVAAIINYAFIEKSNNWLMRFGWLDFEEDEAIVKALLGEVETWAIKKGMTAVHGPLGFTNFDYAGFLIRGFDQLGTFATIYNYPYYPLLLEQAGYGKAVDWVEYKIEVPGAVPEKLVKIAAIVEKRYQLRAVKVTTTKELLLYAPDIFRLINDAYADLYGTMALTEKLVAYYTRKYLAFIRPDFVSLVVDRQNELVAFGITMPSLSKALQKAKGSLYPFGFVHLLKAFKKNRLADLCLVAIRKDLQGKGVNAILMNELTAAYIKNGIAFAESNPELEDNKKVQSIWEYYSTVQHKRRRCYIKYLS